MSDVLTRLPENPKTVWRGEILLSLLSAACRFSPAAGTHSVRALFYLMRWDVNTGWDKGGRTRASISGGSREKPKRAKKWGGNNRGGR